MKCNSDTESCTDGTNQSNLRKTVNLVMVVKSGADVSKGNEIWYRCQ